jgi:ferrous iron transport protein B
MGLTEENWPATVGIFTGIFAKEAVVGTLDAMYTQMDAAAGEDAGQAAGFNFWSGIKESFATIPENLVGVADTMLDPLGLSVGDVSSTETAAEAQEVSTGTFGAMVNLFDGRIGAFAYLLFILLYFPCVAAIAAVYRETNLKWTVFVGAWTTGIAYLASILFYQTATIARHPVSSLIWIGVLMATFITVVLIFRHIGNKDQKAVPGILEGAQA